MNLLTNEKGWINYPKKLCMQKKRWVFARVSTCKMREKTNKNASQSCLEDLHGAQGWTKSFQESGKEILIGWLDEIT